MLLPTQDSRLSKPSKVQAQQARTISQQRINQNFLGNLSKDLMQLVDAALKFHLALL